ncbi:MAG: OmpA family protein, partial [Pseudomonadota bacterium]
LEPAELIENIVTLARKYKHHHLLFNLATSALDYFAGQNEYDLAREALVAFQPHYPDSSVCATDLYFQVSKQNWFRAYADLLVRKQEAAKQSKSPEPAITWNTPDNDEFALVSWGQTDEVYFARRNRQSNINQIMTSRKRKQVWSKPSVVPKLSIDKDVVPLSVSAGGRQMLLKAGGKLLRASRATVNHSWGTPEEMPTGKKFAGNAWISPDDSTMIFEYYATSPGPNHLPQKDLGIARVTLGGNYKQFTPLGEIINLPESSEGNPMMANEGRVFFYTSDHQGGLGKKDMYRVTLSAPGNWSTQSEPYNLGLPINSIFDDHGLTYFSEYTGMAYFHRTDRCDGDSDIWQVQLDPDVFPENAMRLAGVVIDEKGKPIGGGFMEFTPDYQLSVHAEPISRNGTYNYTVADQTEVVRLFPEIPGYYSEHDTTHFLANVTKGAIIRDTFVLTSFDYIRRNFKLIHSTFFNGQSEFDEPAKAFPELTRLAKIATRMGAELELTGHTDGTGAETDNQQLSIDRAQSVKEFLVEKCGFDSSRIQVYGYGSSRPICENDTEEGRRCNRRVEVLFKMPELPGRVY